MKPIPGFPGYQITTDGRVWSEYGRWGKGQWLKPHKTPNGYLQVTLYNKQKPYIFNINILVLRTYVQSRPKGMVCRHLNRNKQDNRVKNLRWGTWSENSYDAVQHGTHPGFQNKGSKHGMQKLTETKVKLIRYLYSLKMFSQRDLAWQFDVSQHAIMQIVNQITWKHV